MDGSSHFSANEPFVPLGKSVLRWRMLASRGWRVVTVPYYRWAVLRTADERKEYLWHLLQVGGGILGVVWWFVGLTGREGAGCVACGGGGSLLAAGEAHAQ